MINIGDLNRIIGNGDIDINDGGMSSGGITVGGGRGSGAIGGGGYNPGTGGGYNYLPSDPTFTSGNLYAQSIAGGQNVPNMIAPGMSYSAANPQGYTQDQVSSMNPGTPPDAGYVPTPPKYRNPMEDKVYYGGSPTFDESAPPPEIFDDFISIGGPGGNGGLGDGNIRYPHGYQGFDFSGFQQLLDNLPAQKVDANDYKDDIMKIVNENLSIPTFDDSEIKDLIAANTTGINSIPQFDPSTLDLPDFSNFAKLDEIPQYDDSYLRDMINNNANTIGNIPQFDPSSINNQIGGLQDQILNIPKYDDSALRDMIGNIPQYDDSELRGWMGNIDEKIGNHRMYDDSALRDRITSIENKPDFNINDYKDDFINIAKEGIDMPTYESPDLSNFLTKDDIPTYEAPNIDDLLARLDALEKSKPPVLPPVIDDTANKKKPVKIIGAF